MTAKHDLMLSELYDELRAAAARMLRRDAPALTLQPTELVNEASLRIVRLDRMSFADKQHFFATSARIMRQAMMDAVRSRRRAKRQAPTILFEDAESGMVDTELLDRALTKLEGTAPDLARIVELRFFVGLGLEEISAVLGLSESTAKRRWKAARLWLLAELSDAEAAGQG
jgi:RNA polymerase sigma factor (TIGR02999 family)